MIYYGQHGEDVLLHYLFPEKRRGFFVEAGCIDGRRFSNTLFFEEQGWHGICIEAHNDYIPYLRKNRPNSIVYHCSVGDEDKESVKFYANSRGSFSSLEASFEDEYRQKYGKYFTGFSQQDVPMKRFNTIFAECNVGDIDILSVDIEGYELKALKALDFTKYRPRVLVVEADSVDQERGLNDLLIRNGYRKLLQIAANFFYVDEGAVPDRSLENIKRDFLLKITGNVLIDEEEKVVPATICTASGPAKYVQKLRALVSKRKIYFPKLFDSSENLVKSTQ